MHKDYGRKNHLWSGIGVVLVLVIGLVLIRGCAMLTTPITVIFIDDGSYNSSLVETITLEPRGRTGKHFDVLYEKYRKQVGINTHDIVYDVVDDNSLASSELIATAIEQALLKKPTIINISLAMTKRSFELEEVIGRARAQGIIVVASTLSGIEPVDSYPASYSGVIGVFPLKETGRDYFFTNRQGGDIGVQVPSYGGSSLGAVLVTAGIVKCDIHSNEDENIMVNELLRCNADNPNPSLVFHEA